MPSILSACPQKKPVLPLSFLRHTVSNLSLKICNEVQISDYSRASLFFLLGRGFFMISNLHIPCYTLSLVLCTLDIKNKLFSSSTSIFYLFRECYHIPSQSDLLQTKQPPYFNLSSLVMFSGLLIILVGLFWTLSNQPHLSWTMVPKIGEKRIQQKNHIPCHADGTPVYISQYGVCFSHGNLNSSDFSSACHSQLRQILRCWLFHIPYLYIWLFLPKYRTVYLAFVFIEFHPFPSQSPR